MLAQGIKSFVVQPFVIPSGSMLPTIQLGDRVIAEKLTYRFSHPPKPGEIVVFANPQGYPPILIKRVVALGGQTVDLKGGGVYVDGKPVTSHTRTVNRPSRSTRRIRTRSKSPMAMCGRWVTTVRTAATAGR